MTMTCIELQPLLAERYQVVEVLRESNVAQVITADDLNTGDRVLIKIYEQQSQSAYRREAAVVLAVSHPQLVNCLETFYLKSGQACLVYEYFPHGSLQNYITNRLISHNQLLWLLADILNGLSFLHQSGFVHCDLKPDNILIRHDSVNNRLHAVIADLGSATPIKEAKLGKHRIGSPAYTAPERIYDGFTHNSDLYSVGIMAFQLYTGQLPFIGSVQDIYRAHLAQLPALSEIYDLKIRDLIGMLLEKKAQNRIATAEEALDIVNNMLLEKTPPTKPNISEDAPEIQYAPPVSIRHLRSGVLDQEPNQLFVFGNTPWLGVNHGSYIQFVDMSGSLQGPIQLSHGPFLPQPDGSILFPTEDCVQRCYPTSRNYRLDIWCKGATALCINQDHVAVMDSRQLLIYDIEGALKSSTIARNYALEPVLSAHPKGGFLVSSGMANHELRWIGVDGDGKI
jgi:serine/threonine protein kinase